MEMLFVRDFAGFSGGHLKFSDYMKHTAASGLATPVLYQTPRSRAVPGNIFNDHNGATIDELRPFPAYFVAGEDWFILDEAGVDPGGAPVVNLIQGFRHAVPRSPLFVCLARPALRICVSSAVASAIRDYANGEVIVIENGVEVGLVGNTRSVDPPARVMIAGLKNPAGARQVAVRLSGVAEVDLITHQLPREIFLARIAQASICIMLPLAAEGFFLPPLEAMALGRGVITPACSGNLCYCVPGVNCLMPHYNADALADAAMTLIHDGAQLAGLAMGGLKTAAERSIEVERAAYHAVLAHYIGRSTTSAHAPVRL
jgi:glycosyltransferase involved in cell wall biosynthesis